MEKAIKLVLMFFLVGCGPSDFYDLVGHRRFKVGDCLIQSTKEPESWEKVKPEYIVVELGKRKYRVKHLELSYYTEIDYGYLWEDFYQKVDCK